MVQVRRHLDPDAWKIKDLPRSGWQITAKAVEAMVTSVTSMASEADWDTTQ